MQEPNGELSVLVPVPAELLEEVGIGPFDTIQMHTDGSRVILEPAEKAQTPGGDARKAVFAFLDDLTESQRYQALVHLTLLWARSHCGEESRWPSQ